MIKAPLARRLRAACVPWLLLTVACAGSTPKANTAGATAAPESKPVAAPLLFQPSLTRTGEDATQQGTGFTVRAEDGRLFAVTSAHFIGLDGPALERVDMLSVVTDASLGSATHCWGRPGPGGQDEPLADLGDDLLVMPLEAPLSNLKPVTLSESTVPKLSARVWLPNKDDASPTGYQRVGGVVTKVELGRIIVRLDQIIWVRSQSGSPVLLEGDDSLVGVVSRGTADADGATELWLTPALHVRTAVDPSHAAFPLSAVAGAGGLKEKVEFHFGWPRETLLHVKRGEPGQDMSQPTLPSRVTYDLKVSPRDAGLQIAVQNFRPAAGVVPQTSLAKAMFKVGPTPPLHISAEGAFEGLEDPQGYIDAMLRELGPQTPEAEGLRRMVTPRLITGTAAADWSRQVAMWIGASPEVGEVYSFETQGASPIDGQPMKTTIYFSATQRTACTPEDGARHCVAVWMRQQVDPEQLRRSVLALVGASLPKDKLPELEKQLSQMTILSEVRMWLITDPRTLMPYSYMLEKFTTVPGQKERYEAQIEVLDGLQPAP